MAGLRFLFGNTCTLYKPLQIFHPKCLMTTNNIKSENHIPVLEFRRCNQSCIIQCVGPGICCSVPLSHLLEPRFRLSAFETSGEFNMDEICSWCLLSKSGVGCGVPPCVFCTTNTSMIASTLTIAVSICSRCTSVVSTLNGLQGLVCPWQHSQRVHVGICRIKSVSTGCLRDNCKRDERLHAPRP